jgi:methionine-rich copper-binding protein CopC
MYGVLRNPSTVMGSEGSVLLSQLSGTLLLLACLSLTVASPAWAHTRLVESDPAGGDVLAGAPEQVRLRFDGPVRFEQTEGAGSDLLDPIQVYDEQGDRVDRGDTRRAASDDPNVLLVDLKRELPDGVYGVDWTVTAKDGHLIDGALGFTVDRSRAQSEGGVDPGAKHDEGAAPGTTLITSFAILGLCVVALAILLVLRRR